MRRLFGVVLAGAILILPAFSQSAFAQQAQAPQKTTFTGDAVIQAFSVNPDKTADYEMVIGKLKEGLAKSTRPEAKQQAAGWKVFKNATPNPDGSIVATLYNPGIAKPIVVAIAGKKLQLEMPEAGWATIKAKL